MGKPKGLGGSEDPWVEVGRADEEMSSVVVGAHVLPASVLRTLSLESSFFLMFWACVLKVTLTSTLTLNVTLTITLTLYGRR